MLLAGEVCIGIVALIGIYMLITENPRLLHEYHRATTSPENLLKLARWSGLGIVLVGVSCGWCVENVAALSSEWLPTWMANPFLLVLSLSMLGVGAAIMIVAIKQYNGSIFS